MSGGCVNPIGIAPDLSFLLYKNKSSFAMLFALSFYSYIVPNKNLRREIMIIKDIEYKLKDGRNALIRSPQAEDIKGMLELSLYFSK